MAESKTGEIVQSISELAKTIPIYQDAIQPASKEIGKSLETITKAINVALAPIRGMIWGYEKIENFVNTTVAEKLKSIPIENIITPNPHIAGPTLEALKYTGHDENLREMFANLLAASMNKETADKSHPSFVEIIKQLTSDEAKILQWIVQISKDVSSVENVLPMISLILIDRNKHIDREILTFSLIGYKTKCEFYDNTPIYISNLCRLGLQEKINANYDRETFGPLENHDKIISLKKRLNKKDGISIETNYYYLQATPLGMQFMDICITGGTLEVVYK